MTATLQVVAAQHSAAISKASNDDACGIHIPRGTELNSKGVAAVIADGMSGSDAGKDAAEACVTGFLADYFTTPDSWSTETAAGKTLAALNRWLYAQGQRQFASGKGMVTTLSVLVVKPATAHLFHVGDTRIWRMRNGRLECLTGINGRLLAVCCRKLPAVHLHAVASAPSPVSRIKIPEHSRIVHRKYGKRAGTAALLSHHPMALA